MAQNNKKMRTELLNPMKKQWWVWLQFRKTDANEWKDDITIWYTHEDNKKTQKKNII